MLNFAIPRTFALALALGLALPLPRAFAQAQAPAAAPAPAPGLGAEQVDLGRQLIVATGLQVNFPNTVIAMMEQVGRTLLRTRPELAEPLRAVLLANEADFLKEAEPMLEIASKIVASRMTGQELKDAIAFFNSPSGKKYIAAQPLILEEMVLVTDDWRKKMSVSMFEKVRAEMKKKGFEL